VSVVVCLAVATPARPAGLAPAEIARLLDQQRRDGHPLPAAHLPPASPRAAEPAAAAADGDGDGDAEGLADHAAGLGALAGLGARSHSPGKHGGGGGGDDDDGGGGEEEWGAGEAAGGRRRSSAGRERTERGGGGGRRRSDGRG
jgi:hypothetical protein